MPGVRRRLRDVTKKVSGVLAGPRDEPDAPHGTDDPAPPTAEETPIPAAPAPESAPALLGSTSEPADVLSTEVAPAEVPPSEPSSSEVLSTAPSPVETHSVEAPSTEAPSAEAPSTETPASETPASETLPIEVRVAEDQPVVERSAASAVDERCAAAVDLARAAAAEVADTPVGEHLGVQAEGDDGTGYLVTHWFASSDPAYTGWRWAVSVARAEGSDEVTVDEVVLLPGAEALLAPAWVPWSERVQPGDLGPGDLLPPPADDPRLVPAYADVDADLLPFDLHRELGLGRPRVLSLDGRADAAERWYEGPAGPDTPVAQAAPGRCGGCGFLVPLAGALGRVFGACANAMAPDDGRVVALTHGCGAHSETVVEQPESTYSGMAVELEVLEELELVDVDAGPPSRG